MNYQCQKCFENYVTTFGSFCSNCLNADRIINAIIIQPLVIAAWEKAKEQDRSRQLRGDLTDYEYEDLYKKAVSIVLTQNNPSLSNVQRTLRISLSVANRIFHQMLLEGILSFDDSVGYILKKNE